MSMPINLNTAGMRSSGGVSKMISVEDFVLSQVFWLNSYSSCPGAQPE